MDHLIHAFHALFWGAFLARGLRRMVLTAPQEAVTDGAQSTRSSPRARRVFAIHAVGFTTLYTGINQAVVGIGTPRFLFEPHWKIGAVLIVLAAAILAWALFVFDSWRLLARVDAGHRLCTRGPYAWIRHPIYLACDLLALGTFLRLPTSVIAGGVFFMCLGGDLRGRAEEAVLREAFGEEYRRYEASARRLVPGVY